MQRQQQLVVRVVHQDSPLAQRQRQERKRTMQRRRRRRPLHLDFHLAHLLLLLLPRHHRRWQHSIMRHLPLLHSSHSELLRLSPHNLLLLHSRHNLHRRSGRHPPVECPLLLQHPQQPLLQHSSRSELRLSRHPPCSPRSELLLSLHLPRLRQRQQPPLQHSFRLELHLSLHLPRSPRSELRLSLHLPHSPINLHHLLVLPSPLERQQQQVACLLLPSLLPEQQLRHQHSLLVPGHLLE